MPIEDQITTLLSILTLITGILIILFLADGIYANFKRKNLLPKLWHWLRKNSLNLMFAIALVATMGSLFYSEIAGFDPCKLCWWQRIYMYPLVILYGLTIIKDNKKELINLGAILSFIGAIFAGFHYYLQIADAQGVSCSVIGYSATCSEFFVLNLGYITIPMMALTAFLGIIVLTFLHKTTPNHIKY